MVNNCVEVTLNPQLVMYYISGIGISEGREFDCVVLHIDVVNSCVEVTLNPQFVMYYMYTPQV